MLNRKLFPFCQHQRTLLVDCSKKNKGKILGSQGCYDEEEPNPKTKVIALPKKSHNAHKQPNRKHRDVTWFQMIDVMECTSTRQQGKIFHYTEEITMEITN